MKEIIEMKKNKCVIVGTGRSTLFIREAIEPIIDIINEHFMDEPNPKIDQNVHIVLTPGGAQQLFTKMLGESFGIKKCHSVKHVGEPESQIMTFGELYCFQPPKPILPIKQSKDHNEIAVFSTLRNCDKRCKLVVYFIEEISEKILCGCKKIPDWDFVFMGEMPEIATA
jgi:hypothetical protein